MHSLWRFIRSHVEEILILGIAMPLIVGALATGNLLAAAVLLVVSIVALIALYGLADRVARRRKPRSIGESAAFKVPRRAIIFTVGRQIDTIVLAIDQQHPELIGLICSTVTEPYADDIIARFGLDDEHVRKRVVDPWNVREIHAETDGLIEWLLGRGLPREAVVVDVTGGMTTMSVSVFAATEDRLIDSQYVRSEYDQQNKPIPGTQEGIFVSRYSISGRG
jgi:hypothetical protein